MPRAEITSAGATRRPDPPAMTPVELERRIRNSSIDTVIVAVPDMVGQLVGKRVHAAHYLETASRDISACDYLLATDVEMNLVPGYAVASWAKGYGDVLIQPDPSALYVRPWQPGTAIAIGDVLLPNGEPAEHSPRAVLKRQIKRATDCGLVFSVASELEFYVFDDAFEVVHRRDHRELSSSGYYVEDYHIFQTSKREHLLRKVRNDLYAAGVPVEATKGE